MEKYFVTHSQAVTLKELGFDEPCISWYTVFGKFSNDYSNPKKYNSEYELGSFISAPLKSQVFEWFREKYNLISCIRTISYGCTIDEQEFYCEIVSVRGVSSYSLHNKFEEAESECIDKLIEIVKNK
jgi:hypothetical protein